MTPRRSPAATSWRCCSWSATVFSAIASANGCINDASRAWFSMGRDRYLPAWFAAVHPKYRTPYPLDPVPDPDRGGVRLRRSRWPRPSPSRSSRACSATPSCRSTSAKFRRKWPLGSIKRGYRAPVPSDPGDRADDALRHRPIFAVYLGFGTQLFAMIGLLHLHLALVPASAVTNTCGAATSSP